MKQLELGQVKEIQLQILDAVADFCDTHNIKYWLDYGTLLGAVRHKGYIPWDDDIDIGMLREDYERFYELFNRDGERYRLFRPERDEDFLGVCGKVCDIDTILYEPDINGIRLHLNIDIFVYDTAPREETRVRQLYHRADRYLLFHMLQYGLIADRGQIHRQILLQVAKVLLKVFPKKYFLHKLICNGCNEKNTDPEKIGMFGWGDYLLLDRKVVTDIVELQFENRTYHAPRDYDSILTQQYGDYMTLPPAEKQVSHHDFVAYIEETGDGES